MVLLGVGVSLKSLLMLVNKNIAFSESFYLKVLFVFFLIKSSNIIVIFIFWGLKWETYINPYDISVGSIPTRLKLTK